MFEDPSFYVLVSFILFFLFAGRPILRFIKGGLDSEIHNIKQDIEDATSQRDEAQVFLNDAKLKYHQAIKAAQDMVTQAKELDLVLKKECQERIKIIVDKKISMAEQKIGLLQNESFKYIQERLSVLVIDQLRQKILNEKTSFHVQEALEVLKKETKK